MDSLHVAHVIVDRDGVLNQEKLEDWIVSREEWAWERGALEGLAALSGAGIEISVATNQSCIGRGIAEAAAVDALHAWMRTEALAHGARIDRVLVCPHVDEDRCRCRKPAAGLYLDAIELSGVAPENTLAIGDALRDLQGARAAHVRAALVRTGKGRSEEARCRALADFVFDDLSHAARCISGLAEPPSR
jgi:D-glycero-D-manno-heptose 1,7-bisphosphate phosphatase